MKVMITKTYSAEIKQLEDNGTGQAVFATLNVEDRDGDVTIPGAFGNQTVKLAGAHNWHAPNVGMARIREANDSAVADFRFYLDMPSAKEWYLALKGNFESGVSQEWSYGFDVVEEGRGEHNGHQVRFLKRLKVHEVSPVMVGAGVDTRTVNVKGLTMEQEFESVEQALTQASGFIEREKALAALREKEGRTLSRANRERLGKLLSIMGEIRGDIESLLDETDPEKAAQLYAAYLKTQNELRGVLTGR